MSGLASGAWWPLSAEPAKAGLSDEIHKPTGDEVQPTTQEQNKPEHKPENHLASFWTWSAGLASIPQETVETSPQEDPEHIEEEPVHWWSSIIGLPTTSDKKALDLNSNSHKDNDTVQKAQTRHIGGSQNKESTSENLNEQPTLRRSWFTWPFFLDPQRLDHDADPVDNGDLEAFREAKLAVESCKDSCHYAVAKVYGCDDVHMAVSGTSTKNSPVKFNQKKQPIMPHQHLESAMAGPRPNRAEGSADSSKKRLVNEALATENSDTSKSKLPSEDLSKSLQNGNAKSGNAEGATLETNQGNRGTDVQSVSQTEEAPMHVAPISPHLDSNFRVITLATKLRLWGEAVMYKQQTSERHIYRATQLSVERNRRKISKRAIVISVHSFLPTKFVRSVIAQSTGNASLIAANAVSAISRWAAKGNIPDMQVQSIALDGIGTMHSRKEKSIQLLKNWASEIKHSDVVFVMSNSTAGPVAIQILQHMLVDADFGLEHKKIGFLSMSGALHGQVTGLVAKIVRRAYTSSELELIQEMLDLQRSNSELSVELMKSMNELCQRNVKLTLVGSVDDQFVPVFSSVCHQTSHPHIFKCLYIDKDSEVPGFLIRLLSMVLKMENVGYADHYQLLRDLLELTQGPLTTFASHGDIYNCPDVYDIGVKFALETTCLTRRKEMVVNPLTAYTALDTERNLYRLPWNVRGLVNDLLQIKHIKSAKLLRDLVSEYNSWEPTARPWRDVKQCFAAFEEFNPDEFML